MKLHDYLPKSIELVEVGLRDGLQAVSTPLATEHKIEIIHELIDAGVREIEAVSFAHPRVLPQLADAEQVMAAAPRVEGVTYRGLVPNLRGAQRATSCDLDSWTLVIAADEEMSLRNQQRTVDEMLGELVEVAKLAQRNGVKLVVGIACAFFAPSQGPVSRKAYLRVVDASVDSGAEAVYLACTTGQEHPREVSERVNEVRERYPDLGLGVHLHNRNGFAAANAIASMVAGIDWLEGSFCGLGGDMWFPGDPSVLGNVPYEDLIHLCESVGVRTGVDLSTYLKVAARVTELTGIASTSYVSRGGTRQELAEAEWPEDAESRNERTEGEA